MTEFNGLVCFKCVIPRPLFHCKISFYKHSYQFMLIKYKIFSKEKNLVCYE